MGYFTNTVKTTVLLALLTALMLWVGDLFGGTQGLIIAGIFVVLFNGVMYWWSDKIVLKMYGAKELPKDHKVTRMVEEVARKAGLKTGEIPRAFIVENATPNAFATGRNPSHSVVAVTAGIIGLLTDEELRGVIAHEVSHIINRDTLIQTVAGVVAGVISYTAAIARWGAIFGGFGGRDRDSGGLIELLVIGILSPIIALIIQMAISRTREYMADANAAKIIHSGKPLAHALEKLERGVKMRPFGRGQGNPATSSLFIVNPFRGSFLFEMFSTHPPMQKRIEKLNSY
ncbi:zinc metalloprotease HtpX [Candidatus Woesearchaeota archaeon]|nr:zinc metalloprotease HtpX [Candidatus Woesearchaeota archaeon]